MWVRAGRIVLACATIVAVVIWLRRQPQQPMPNLADGWPFLFLAIAAVVPALLFRAIKWKLVLKPVLPTVSVATALRSYVAAMPYSLITPGRVGEFARLLYLPRCPRGLPQGAALVLFDKIMDLAALLWWAVAGLYLVFGLWLALLGAVAALTVSALPWWIRFFGSLRRWVSTRFAPHTDRAVEPLWGEGYSPALALQILAFGILGFAVEWFQVWCLVRIWSDGAAPIVAVAGIMSLVTLANVLQLTTAGLGIREGLAGWLLSRYASAPKLAAVSSAFGLFVLDQGIPALAGLLIKTQKEVESGLSKNERGDETVAAHATEDPPNTEQWRAAYRQARLSFWHDDAVTMTRRLSKMGMDRLPPSARILDIGCGGGRLLAHMSANGFRDCWGIEADKALVLRSPQKNRIVVGSATELPWRGESFDGVLIMAVLHHLGGLQQLSACVSEVRRVLRPGGFIAYCEPADTIMRRALTCLLLSPMAGLSSFARSKRQMVIEERDRLAWWLSIERDVPDLLAKAEFAGIRVRRESLKTYVVARKE